MIHTLGAGAGWKCSQGFEGSENLSSPSAARHQVTFNLEIAQWECCLQLTPQYQYKVMVQLVHDISLAGFRRNSTL